MGLKEITKRWRDVAIIGLEPYDLVEIDNEYYSLVKNYLEEYIIVNRFNSGEYTEKYTFKELLDAKSLHPNIRTMLSYVSIRKDKCVCGGTSANTTHSDWCPKYLEV